MPNMDRLTATPLGSAVWFTALIAFSWPIIRFGRAWLAAPMGGLAAGVATYALRHAPELNLNTQTKFLIELVVFGLGIGLGYLVLVRGVGNPYRRRR
jgi:hypothetical protein